VDVIVLNRVLHQPEAPAFAPRSEAALELSDQLHTPQRGQAASHLQRHVARKAGGERSTHPVIVARARAALAARTRASSAPAGAFAQIEIELPNSSCHAPQCDMQV
jgi:hypothetical protein